MKKLSLICMTVLAVFAMASCRGPKGDPGNANVASSTVTVHSDDWEWVNNCQWMVTIDFAAINNNVYNYGAVLVYMKVGNAWSQVPLTYYYQDEVNIVDDAGNPVLDENGHQLTEIINCAASIEVATLNDGGVSLYWTESDFYKNPQGVGRHDFKIVAIEASVYANRTDVDYSNYNAVKTAFQLAD